VNIVTQSAVYDTRYANLDLYNYNTVPAHYVSFQLLNNGETGLIY